MHSRELGMRKAKLARNGRPYAQHVAGRKAAKR